MWPFDDALCGNCNHATVHSRSIYIARWGALLIVAPAPGAAVDIHNSRIHSAFSTLKSDLFLVTRAPVFFQDLIRICKKRVSFLFCLGKIISDRGDTSYL